MTQTMGGPAKWSSLRPENTRLGPTSAIIGTVTGLRYLGAATRVALTSQGCELAALIPAGHALPSPGAQIAITFDPENLHIMEDN
jgi:putative spermidine/putrescine transport system ATP-binding protein